MSYPRRTPVHAAIESSALEWGDHFGMTVALAFTEPGVESGRLADLGLADLSAIPRVGLKGPTAETWLKDHGWPAPSATYERQRLDDGSLVVRNDTQEFLIEGTSAAGLADELGYGTDGAYRVERQDCSLLITGERALAVFAQTCGVDVAEMGDAFFKTRIALTSCSVMRDDVGTNPAWRLWFDPSYAEYLWTALLEIITELGGGPVGWGCLKRAVER
jgi:sarcosine oxidase subunit gamma